MVKKNLETGLIVDESQKTKKARKKLQERLETIEKKVTKEDIDRKSQEISRWIERHSSDRVAVKKDIPLFDTNKNSVKPSRVIEKIAEDLSSL